jgi:hypothetical protein
MNILQDFPNNITNLLNDKTSVNIGSIDDCPYLKIKFKFRNKEYIEIFNQQSVNNKELWSCSSNSYLFSKKIYNIYKLSNNDKIELNNINKLISGENKIMILNFTNDMYDYDEFIEDYAQLL